MQRAEMLEVLADAIDAIRPSHPTRVAIDGMDAAGKTTLADELVVPLRERGRQLIRASVDGFHRPRAERYRRGPLSPEGYYLDSFDYPTLKERLLDSLGPNGHRRYQTASFDYRIDASVDPPIQVAEEDAILLFDGIFLLRPELASHWDFRIFVDVKPDVVVARALARDLSSSRSPAALRRRYEQRYLPAQRLYLSRCRPEARADAIVDNNELLRPHVRFLPCILG